MHKSKPISKSYNDWAEEVLQKKLHEQKQKRLALAEEAEDCKELELEEINWRKATDQDFSIEDLIDNLQTERNNLSYNCLDSFEDDDEFDSKQAEMQKEDALFRLNFAYMQKMATHEEKDDCKKSTVKFHQTVKIKLIDQEEAVEEVYRCQQYIATLNYYHTEVEANEEFSPLF